MDQDAHRDRQQDAGDGDQAHQVLAQQGGGADDAGMGRHGVVDEDLEHGHRHADGDGAAVAGGLGEGEDDRHQDDEGDVEEDRDRDQSGGHQQVLVEALLAERLSGGGGDPLGAAGAFDDAADHGPEPDQQGDVAEGSAHALDHPGHDVLDGDAAGQGRQDGDEQQRDEGRPLQFDHGEQQDRDRHDSDTDADEGVHPATFRGAPGRPSSAAPARDSKWSALDIVEVEHLCQDGVQLLVVPDLRPVGLDDVLAAVVHGPQTGLGERVRLAQRVGQRDEDVAVEQGLDGF